MSGQRTGTLYWLPIILGHPDLDPTETLLLVALADHVNADDACYVKIHKLAAAARVSYGTARRRLKALEDRGHITRQRRKRPDGSEGVYDYVLNRESLAGGCAQPARGVRASGRAGGARAQTRALNRPTEPPHEPRRGADHRRAAQPPPVEEILAARPPKSTTAELAAGVRTARGALRP